MSVYSSDQVTAVGESGHFVHLLSGSSDHTLRNFLTPIYLLGNKL